LAVRNFFVWHYEFEVLMFHIFCILLYPNVWMPVVPSIVCVCSKLTALIQSLSISFVKITIWVIYSCRVHFEQNFEKQFYIFDVHEDHLCPENIKCAYHAPRFKKMIFKLKNIICIVLSMFYYVLNFFGNVHHTYKITRNFN